ncbi:MAG: efflux RND transporter permease subunit, partial [Pseudomonadota bacterium]|nr:efflux RND transporter permease subunit [Pseudomonadota bacterium]
LNLISMMGLIIVVGMLVDDAIVITENAQSFIEDGHSPEEAAILGTQNIWSPVTASVMTTVIVFAPMMFMTGIFGKFIYYIPVAVIVSLLVSLWECFFVLPHHLATWVRIKKSSISGSFFTTKVWQPFMVRPYRSILGGVIKLRYVVLLLVLGMFAGSMYLAVKHVGFILFPPGAVDAFRIDFKAKTGTSLAETERLIAPYEDLVAALPADELKHYTSTIGRQGMEDMRNMKRGSEYAQTAVYLTDELTRSRDTATIMNDLKTKIKMPEGLEVANFRQIRGGPPVGDPVNIGVRGQSYDRILLAVQEIEDELANIKGVANIENSYIKGKGEIHVKVKEAEAAAASLSLQDIGMAIRAAFEGIIATSIRSVDEEIDLRVTLNQAQRSKENTLADIQIPNRRGHLISLTRVAEWQDSSGISVYEHEDNRRQVTVTANVDAKITNSRAVNLRMKEKMKELETKYRQLSFHFGGEDKDTKESMASLRTSFMFALFGILLMLILLFKNLYQPLIVATTIPLGIMAVTVAFFMHQRTFSFLAMIGIIALSGVIVNNAIVLLDFINRGRRAGLDRRESLKQAACKRLRPICLTTITTTAGILPTVYGIGGYDPFVVPLAMALGWGVLGGAFLTTLVLPAIIAIVDDIIMLFAFLTRRGVSS